MITATDIRVALNRRPILHGIDLTAEAGRMTCIVGPNGSGKTTLMRAMTGEVDYSGAVSLEGAELKSFSPARLAERRAVLPQATPMAFPFTVFEVVRLGLTGREALVANAAQLPHLALAAVGLQGYEGRFFQQLSGGEQQRAHLARVLVQVWHPVQDGRARWLFLDEPVSSLDIGHQLQIMRLARDFARRGGGVIAVMHDLNLTAMFADKVCLLAEGRKLADGPPARVFADDILSTAYGCALRVSTPPPDGGVFILPQAAT